MTHLFEAGSALEQIKDMLADPENAVSPEDLAPKPTGGVQYSEKDDPEMLKESYSDHVIADHINRLMEAGVNKTAIITQFHNDDKYENKSYEAFQASEYGSTEVNNGTFKIYTKDLQKKGKINLSPEQMNASQGAGGGGSPAARTKGQEFYDAPELDPKYKKSATLSNLEMKYDTIEDFKSQGTAEEQFNNMTDIVADIAGGVSTKRHALIAGDPGVGKTYECTRALEKNIGSHPKGAKMLYFKGNIGKSLTSLVGFFYHYRNNHVIMLDDNDAMLMVGGVPQQIKLFFKAILDPDALTQPIAVPTTVIKSVSNSINELKKADAIKGRESMKIKIDRDRLREGHFLMEVNGREVIDTLVPLHEALELYDSLREESEPDLRNRNKYLNIGYKRLMEEKDDDDDWDELDDDAPDEDDIKNFMSSRKSAKKGAADEGDEDGMPTEFVFDSSVIFISNLTKKEIDPAVWDRFTVAFLELTPLEFMARLTAIYDKLGNVNPAISSTPQQYVDWAKKVVLVLFQGVIEAWQTGTPLMGVSIQIPKRTLTFRFFNDMVEYFLRTARSHTRREGKGNLNDKAYRDKVTIAIERSVLKEIIKKVCFG